MFVDILYIVGYLTYVLGVPYLVYKYTHLKKCLNFQTKKNTYIILRKWSIWWAVRNFKRIVWMVVTPWFGEWLPIVF